MQVPEVFSQVVGRLLASRPALLEGYACFRLRHLVYPAIVEHPGGRVTGLMYSGLDPHELGRLDAYEGQLYERRTLTLRADGEQVEALGYVLRVEHRGQLSRDAWDLEVFRRDHLTDYLKLVPNGFRKLDPE